MRMQIMENRLIEMTSILPADYCLRSNRLRSCVRSQENTRDVYNLYRSIADALTHERLGLLGTTYRAKRDVGTSAAVAVNVGSLVSLRSPGIDIVPSRISIFHRTSRDNLT